MFNNFAFILVILSFLELLVTIRAGSILGPRNAILLIIFSGILGVVIIKIQGPLLMKKLQDQLNQGKMPSGALLDGLLIMAGAILLLIPGFLSDLMGLLLLFPSSRIVIKYLTRNKLQNIFKSSQSKPKASRKRSSTRYDDVEDADFH